MQAHMWFNLAASRSAGESRQDAVQNRDRAAGLMNPTQLAEAQRLAREWDAAHPREPEALAVNRQSASERVRVSYAVHPSSPRCTAYRPAVN